MRILLILAVLLGLSNPAKATQAEFCYGFEEGYKSVKGDYSYPPPCPPKPPTPPGSTDFREGITAGIRAAEGY
jgi:hypothetical protein